jgi:hypothetical protein
MFLLDGKPLSPDRAFTHDGTQYPANWLRLSTLEQKEAIGITEVPDAPSWDQRFYWGYDAEGNLLPKDHAQLVEQWVTTTKVTAGSLLTPSDWYITRQAETGAAVPQEVLDRRAEIRAYSNTKEQALLATTSTDELAAYVTSADYSRWEPEAPAPVEVVIDSVDFASGSTIAGVSL